MTPKYLTASEMRTFQRCRRKWWLGHYRRLIKADQNNFNRPLGIGNRVHEALAVYYTPERPIDPRQYLSESRVRDLTQYPDQQSDIIAECDLAEIMIEGYMEWLEETGEDQAIETIEAEGARVARLEPGGNVYLLSKLDARVRHEALGSRLALEHKTVGSLSQHMPELRLNQQVLTEHLVEYMALIEEGEDPEMVGGVLFNMLRKVKRTARAKPPFYKRELVRHTLSEVRNHWYHVVSIADQIQDVTSRLDAGEDHQLVVPPTPMETCHWQCEFFHQCPLIDSNDDHETALLSRFTIGNPLARYDGLIETATTGVAPTDPLPIEEA